MALNIDTFDMLNLFISSSQSLQNLFLLSNFHCKKTGFSIPLITLKKNCKGIIRLITDVSRLLLQSFWQIGYNRRFVFFYFIWRLIRFCICTWWFSCSGLISGCRGFQILLKFEDQPHHFTMVDTQKVLFLHSPFFLFEFETFESVIHGFLV